MELHLNGRQLSANGLNVLIRQYVAQQSKQLKYLNISDNQIDELYINSGASELEEIDASKNRLETLDIPRLPAMKTPMFLCLKRLILSHNSINKCDGFHEFPNIEYIDLSHNCISSLSGFYPCDKLTYLNLENNYVSGFQENSSTSSSTATITGLSHCHRLRTLLLGNNVISSLSNMSSMLPTKSLQSLALEQNQLCTGLLGLRELSCLSTLIDLRLYGNSSVTTFASDMINVDIDFDKLNNSSGKDDNIIDINLRPLFKYLIPTLVRYDSMPITSFEAMIACSLFGPLTDPRQQLLNSNSEAQWILYLRGVLPLKNPFEMEIVQTKSLFGNRGDRLLRTPRDSVAASYLSSPASINDVGTNNSNHSPNSHFTNNDNNNISDNKSKNIHNNDLSSLVDVSLSTPASPQSVSYLLSEIQLLKDQNQQLFHLLSHEKKKRKIQDDALRCLWSQVHGLTEVIASLHLPPATARTTDDDDDDDGDEDG